MNALIDALLFRRMVSPVLLQVLYWGATVSNIYFSIRLIQAGYLAGWMALIFGTLGVRVLFELILLNFRIYDRLGAIENAVSARPSE